MSRTRHLLGIVLAKENWRENDQIISFYSQESGKLEILVRGARKINSKLAPLISEPFALLDLVVAQGKNYTHLIGGEVKERFKNIITEEQKIIQTNTLLKRINQLIKPQLDKKIFLLILKFLKKINQIPLNKIRIINHAFLIKFLAFSGYCPEIKICLVCHQIPQGEEIIFNLEKGGIVCLPCQQAGLKYKLDDNQNNQQIKITKQTLNVLQKFLYQDFNSLIQQNFVQKDLQVAEKVIKLFFNWHLD
ncbi:DNA repair protein RecO [Patescibacteria group bacterium]|nr:DNA repair protein RecO [Patescibacteria group bacterium]